MRKSIHGIISFVVPGLVIVITPPIAQLHIDVLFNAGAPRTRTVGLPGAHGATVAGTQGVGTPNAAAVRILHVPKGMMLTKGAKSKMLAAGLLSASTVGGITTSVEGAVPAAQVSMAPRETSCGMSVLSRNDRE